MTNFIATSSGDRMYPYSNRRAQAITESIMWDLVVGESMPLRLVQSKGFNNFLSVVDPRYKSVCRQTVKNKIHLKSKAVKEMIVKKLSNVAAVNVTVDIWTDRKMRSFLGVTAHIFEEKNENLKLVSYTLACERFLGKHTGSQIAKAFSSTLDDFKIENKLDYVITDNAANMKKAFTTAFAAEDERMEDMLSLDQVPSYSQPRRELESENDVILDDESIWMSLEDSGFVIEITESARKSRLSCYAHTLQLCIRDGLEQSKCMYK